MLAGKNSFGTIAILRTALVAVATIAALAGAPNRAWAICGMPSGLAGALQMSDANPAVAPRTTQLKELPHGPNEPIVGMWMINATDATTGAPFDLVFSGWTGDGLEFDQDLSPILTGYVCYGTWVKVGKNTYGLTHPFFNFMGVMPTARERKRPRALSTGTRATSTIRSRFRKMAKPSPAKRASWWSLVLTPTIRPRPCSSPRV